MTPMKTVVLPTVMLFLSLWAMAILALDASPNISTALDMSTNTLPTGYMPRKAPIQNKITYRSRLAARSDDDPRELKGAILEDLHCFSEAENYDVDILWFVMAAQEFCHNNVAKDATLNPLVGPIGYTASFYIDDHNPSLEFVVDNVKNCSIEGWARWVTQPVEEYSCFDLIFGAWRKCDNDGRGGAVDAACLRYRVRAYWEEDMHHDGVHGWTINKEDKEILDGVNFDE